MLGHLAHHPGEVQPIFVVERRRSLKGVVPADELAGGVVTHVNFGPEHVGGDELAQIVCVVYPVPHELHLWRQRLLTGYQVGQAKVVSSGRALGDGGWQRLEHRVGM